MDKRSGQPLLLTFVILTVFIYQIKADCFTQIPTNYTSDQFFQTPQQVQINACDLSNENTCCTPELSSQIEKYADVWTSSFLKFFSFSSTPCKAAIQGITCVLCSAEQSDYLRFRSNIAQYYLCLSYCQSVYDACATSRKLTTANIIQDEYVGDSNGFCYDLFDMIAEDNIQLVLDLSTSCWDNKPPCTEDSYYAQYTECDGGTRSLVYQKKPEADCTGGVPLPPPETNLPCAVPCKVGQYAGKFGCKPCPVGQYSLGSAIREDRWQSWDDLSIPFTTRCTYLDQYKVEHVLTGVDCGWEIDGFEINSGHLNNSQSSYLETSVVLIDEGQLIFDFRVDSEPRYDGLTVYVDRVVVLEKQSSVFDQTIKVVNLTAGYHFIQFVYSKDQSVSQGADRATINVVQISPVTYAADECTSCRAGRYQNQTGRSFCYDCPANTYSEKGSSKCTKCPPNSYSFEGSATCTEQIPCTADDVYYLYDKCYFSPENELLQTLYPVWNTPHICNDGGHSIPPYPNSTVPCTDCNPGEYRKGTECEYCPDGYASSNGESCEICPVGTQAVKALWIDQFDFWDQGLSTDCSYFCGSPGWELKGDYIESGSGHGRYVNSNLYLEATLPVSGFIMFTYSLNCTASCELEFQYTNGTGASYRGGPGVMNQPKGTGKFSVDEGAIKFRWIFSKNDPDGEGRFDYARIDSIIIANVVDGGATNCTACKPGYHAPYAGSTNCIQCPAGTYSSTGSLSCTFCPEGYFNTEPGSSSCLPCGEGSLSASDRTGCIVTCTFDDNAHSYDLNPIARTDNEMYGPIYDALNQVYYLNVCSREHNNHTCVDINGEPIDTYACQVTTKGFGVDLGDIFGLIPLRHSEYYSYGGVTVHLTHGERCRNSSGLFFNRQTYIDVICDPSAGTGVPTPYNTDDNVVETSKCVYEFAWRSLYGCHICTAEDYTYIISACNSDQKRFIQYMWVNNPKTCHAGVSLPETIEISCTDTLSISCPPGSFLDLSLVTPTCTLAEPGFYSIGGGSMFDDWSKLADGFSTLGWTASPNGKSIASGAETTSLLFLREFVEGGSIDFEYRIHGYSPFSYFQVYLDDVLVFGPINSTNGVYDHAQIAITQTGNHFVKFEFVGGVAASLSSTGIGVELKDIKVLGIYHTAEYQLPCPSGTYSHEGSPQCTLCPANTYSPPSSSECIPCPVGYYSFVGSYSCVKKEPCILDTDYQLTYTECKSGVRYRKYVPLEPFICDSSSVHLPASSSVSCDSFDCPPGQYRNKIDLTCTECAIGSFYDQSTSKCMPSYMGYAGILQTGYYFEPEPSLPSSFVTACEGDCASPSIGWRSRSTYLDSGSNTGKEVDVYLEFAVTLMFSGSIDFQYEISGEKLNGLSFFVNGKQISIPYHPSTALTISIDLEEGENVFRWVYHQAENCDGLATIHHILIKGAGGATEQIPCPAGSFSSSTGSNFCSPCPPGFYSSSDASTTCTPCSSQTFSEFPYSTHCEACGDLTFSNADRTDCMTDCVFPVTTSYGDRQIDLTPLAGSSGPFPLNSTTDKLLLNVCSKKSSPLVCIDTYTGQSISTYSCQVDSTGRGYDSGRLLSVEVQSDESLLLTYVDGGSNSQCSEQISTSLHLICSPDIELSEPFELEGSTPCALKLQWNTSYACPVCTDQDYDVKSTECVDGKQSTALVRKRNCFGSQIVNNVDSDKDCSMGVSWVIITAVCIVIFILIVVIAFILFWNRRIRKKYLALVQNKEGSYEMMSDLPDSLLEEEEDEDPLFD